MIIYLAQVSLQSIAELIPYSAELTKKKASMISSKVVIFHLAYSAGSHVETSASAADPVSFRCPDISFAASHLLPSLNFTDQRIMLQENGRARGSLRGGRMLRWLFGNEGGRLFCRLLPVFCSFGSRMGSTLRRSHTRAPVRHAFPAATRLYRRT
jgi:hypothetical protein